MRAMPPGVALAISFLLGSACSGPGSAPDAASDPAPGPPAGSTAAPSADFSTPAVLVAEEILIEGPPGLRDRFAAAQDPARMLYSMKTVEAGLLQEIAARPGAGPVEIRAQLDAWVLLARRRLRILESPDPCPVVVRATGSASWRTPAGETRRGAALRFEGELSPR